MGLAGRFARKPLWGLHLRGGRLAWKWQNWYDRGLFGISEGIHVFAFCEGNLAFTKQIHV
jgi:hypothetical protein